MNELQVKTVVMEPAKVEFNFDELSDVLDQQLAKYEGLEFTEKEAAACKKTITELNKGKKALNEYRLKTKRELTAPVTDFEESMKFLSNKFDDVIKPLKGQVDVFEDNRKKEKSMEILVIIDELIEKEGLDEKHAAQLVIEDSYLNKSTTLKSIREDLITKAQHLGIAQDKEESDIEIIKMSVEMANQRYGVELLDSTYIRLLEHEDIETIKVLITDDAQNEAEKKDEPKYEQVPLSSAPASKSVDDEEKFTETYLVLGTNSQLDALEEYMNNNGLTWSVVEDD